MTKDIKVQQHTGGFLLIWCDQEGDPPVDGFEPETEIHATFESARARLEELIDDIFG